MNAAGLAIPAALYALTVTGAISGNAGTVDTETLKLAREGSMKRLIVHDQPKEVPGIAISDASGEPAIIGDFDGTIVVLNFWATWCAPCVKEMPSLDRLQTEFDPDHVSVVAVAAGRNPVPKVEKFLQDNGIHALTILYDKDTRLSRAMSVVSIPVTVLIDRNGREVARFIGDTEWDSEEAVQLIGLLARQD